MLKKKLLGLFTAAALAFTAIAPFAMSVKAEEPEKTTQTVTLHKLVMDKQALDSWKADGPEGYNGTQDLEAFKKLTGAENAKEVAGVYFAWKYVGETSGNFTKGKYVKADGTGTDNDIENLTKNDLSKVLGGLTEANGKRFDTANLKGDFEIEEFQEFSTYKGANNEELSATKAVPVRIKLPLVNENGVVENAHIYPKNTEEKPSVDKDFQNGFGGSTGANAGTDRLEETEKVKPTSVSVGDTVPYHIQTKVKPQAKYKTFRWSDVMTKGLTFNNDIEITVTGSAEPITLEAADYTLTSDLSGFVLALNEKGLAKINNNDNELTIDIKYTAEVNSDAVADVPDKNDVVLEYSNKPKNENEESPETPPTSEGKIKVTKTWGQGTTKTDVIFDLYKKVGEQWKVVDTKTLKSGQTEIEFTGLDKSAKYKVRERVNASNPTWGGQDGELTVTNNKDNDNPPPINPEEPSIVTYGKKFVKADSSTNDRLAGAKFVVKNGENKFLARKAATIVANDFAAYTAAEKAYQASVDTYNARENDDEKEQLLQDIATKKEARDKAFNNAYYTYTWVEADTDENVVILSSDDKGRFEISGLKEGTYTLVEKQAPKDYATREDLSFEVGANTYSTVNVDFKYDGTEQQNNALKVGNKKVSIPQTGGIGTVIFTVVGLGIMLIAAMSLRKRNAER